MSKFPFTSKEKKLRKKKTSLLKKLRLKYKEDGVFREEKKRKVLKRYRQNTDFESDRKSSGKNFYKDLVQNISVKNVENNRVAILPVLPYISVAESLDISYSSFCRWISEEMIPKPMFIHTTTKQGVYHVDEVAILLDEISRHTAKYAYYRKDHANTRKNIFARITKLRKGLKNG